MKRIISTALAVALLLGLGALAVLALPGAQATLAPANVAAAPVAFQSAAAPDAPTIGEKYYVIGMPLDAADQFSGATPSLGFDSDGLADFVGSSVTQVLRWNAGRQDFDSWDPVADRGWVNGDPIDIPFDLAIGTAYWLLVDSSGPGVVSFVGDVPNAYSIAFTFLGTDPSCAYNQITIPLEQAGLIDADLLADSIDATVGTISVIQVLQWNPGRQDFDSWDPVADRGWVNGDPVDVPWLTRIGYPYMVCLAAGANDQSWPVAP